MGGQVFGGGVIVLVAALLWLAYLLPSWHARYHFNATERNAVRLHQALRVLAETSDQPDEIRVDLTTRTAHRQTKLARRREQERQRLEAAASRAEHEKLRDESHDEKQRIRSSALEARERRRIDAEAQRDLAKARLAAERARAVAETAAEHERLRAERASALSAPAVVAARQARARRSVRTVASLGSALGVGVLMWGMIASAAMIAVGGVLLAMLGVALLRHMAGVAHRAQRAVAAVQIAPMAESHRERVVVLHDENDYTWTPRSLPQPLTSVAGSRAAAVHDAAEAREALRRAAFDEAARHKAAERAPVRINPAATARTLPGASITPMNDDEIEQHVRNLLASRAS